MEEIENLIKEALRNYEEARWRLEQKDIEYRGFREWKTEIENKLKKKIIELMEELVPKRYDSDPPQDKYEEGQECAYRIIEKRIAKLKEE